jgi:uncharacterized membrane protein
MKFLRDNILSWILLGGGFVYGLFYRTQLPSRIPTHFDFQGQPNSTSPRDLALALFPVIGVLTIALVQILLRASPQKFSMSQSGGVLSRIYFAIAMLMTTLHVGMLNVQLHPTGPGMSFYMGLGTGLFLIGLGNYLGKTERNFFIGIRTPWTLASEQNWLATHRYAGKITVAFGLALLIMNFSQPSVAATGATLAAALLSPVFYSYLYYAKRERRR